MKTIDRKKNQVIKLLNEIQDLKFKNLCKKFVKTYKKEINIGTKKKPVLAIAKYGMWYEWFKDEDRPNEKGIKIERNQIIEIDGNRHGFVKYTLENTAL